VTIDTQVAIIGAGPAGTLLSHILDRAGIESVVVERSSREHVLGRIRAGVLEWGTVELLREVGLGERMDIEGHVHAGTDIVWSGREILTIDIETYADSRFISYGQTNLQEDLYAAADRRRAQIHFEADDVELHDVTSNRPSITFISGGVQERIGADYIVGCDGFHGVSRKAIPADVVRTYHKQYPFGWLGILSETPPVNNIVYAHHERGFALASRRNPMLSRYYVQCPLTDTVAAWSDDRFWSELSTRLGPIVASGLVTGPSIEKSIAPLRSFVAEPMRHGSLFLAGDAAHIVPPTGAKGLNLAVSDVFYMSRALTAHYVEGSAHYLNNYSEMALRRVWGSVRFSWWLTTLLHRFPDQTEFDLRAQQAELDYLASSARAQAAMAEQYAGLPFES